MALRAGSLRSPTRIRAFSVAIEVAIESVAPSPCRRVRASWRAKRAARSAIQNP